MMFGCFAVLMAFLEHSCLRTMCKNNFVYPGLTNYMHTFGCTISSWTPHARPLTSPNSYINFDCPIPSSVGLKKAGTLSSRCFFAWSIALPPLRLHPNSPLQAAPVFRSSIVSTASCPTTRRRPTSFFVTLASAFVPPSLAWCWSWGRCYDLGRLRSWERLGRCMQGVVGVWIKDIKE